MPIRPIPVARPNDGQPLDREMLPYFWHPDRLTVECCPADFDAKLKAIHPGLACTRFPIENKWILWSRKPDITHPLCPGWLLLFVWEDEEHNPLPLDNRVFYNLYRRDPRRYRSCVEYFDLAMAELKDAKDRRAKDEDSLSRDRGRDFRNYTKIKNIGHGAKAALHHDGSVIPSRGERNWLHDRGGVMGERRRRRE
jgi:hypothetical protein